MDETIGTIAKNFRISLVASPTVSQEAIRQFARVVENAIDGKPAYRMTAPDGKVTYHATASDIARYLQSKGIINAQIANIHMSIRQKSHAYNHTIETIKIERTF